MSAEDSQVLYRLETEVEAELLLVQSGGADKAPTQSQADWLFDPTDIERYRISLRSLLGAVTGVERARETDCSSDETELR